MGVLNRQQRGGVGQLGEGARVEALLRQDAQEDLADVGRGFGVGGDGLDALKGACARCARQRRSRWRDP